MVSEFERLLERDKRKSLFTNQGKLKEEFKSSSVSPTSEAAPIPTPVPIPEPKPEPSPEPKSDITVSTAVSGEQKKELEEKDVAFFRDPKTGEVKFAGEGAEEERQFAEAAGRGEIPEEEAADIGRARGEAFEGATGVQDTIDKLTGQIRNPVDLTPESIVKKGGELLDSRTFQPVGISAVSASGKLLLDPAGELKRAGVETALGLGLASLSLGFLSKLVAGGKVAAISKAGGSLFSLKGAVSSLALFFGAKSAFDFEGGEMQSYRAAMQSVVEDGERLIATVRTGQDAEDAIEEMGGWIEEVNEAERVLKQLGERNVKYRVDKRFIQDMSKIRSTRLAIRRRLNEARTIALTGAAALKPEELLFTSEQIGGAPSGEF